MVLKFHSEALNEHTKIDKFALVPKKFWGNFQLGENKLAISGRAGSFRVYDIFCECVGPSHTHRIIDLRSHWQKLGLSDGDKINIQGV